MPRFLAGPYFGSAAQATLACKGDFPNMQITIIELLSWYQIACVGNMF
jgi:hypothetical protein